MDPYKTSREIWPNLQNDSDKTAFEYFTKYFTKAYLVLKDDGVN